MNAPFPVSVARRATSSGESPDVTPKPPLTAMNILISLDDRLQRQAFDLTRLDET